MIEQSVTNDVYSHKGVDIVATKSWIADLLIPFTKYLDLEIMVRYYQACVAATPLSD